MTEKKSLEERFSEFFEEIEARIAAKQLKRENPYVLDLIRVLGRYPQGLHRQLVLDRLYKNRRERGLSIPAKFDESVQNALQQHCADSAAFKKSGKPQSEALFHWPDGKGAGKWAMYPDRAEAWLKSRSTD